MPICQVCGKDRSIDDGRYYPPEEPDNPDWFMCYECMIDMRTKRLADENDALIAERDETRAELRAFIANIEEMSIGVGLPDTFIVFKDGRAFGAPPDRAESFYKAIMDKWHNDKASLIRLYDDMESGTAALRARIAELEAALRWYADPVNYAVWRDGHGTMVRGSLADEDAGDRARRALGES